jgi:multiple antibiotic resistance protein
MVTAAKVFFLILSALFPIVDPLSGSPIFLALTKAYSPEMRRVLSWHVALDSFFLLVGSYFVGSHVLAFFGVSLPVVQVGGGLVVISIGWTMLMQKEEERGVGAKNVQAQDVFRRAFYPLTLPLTVGPGSVSVAITLGANSAHRYGFHPLIILAALVSLGAIALSIFLCYGFSDRLARVLGETAMAVIVRLSSFLLLCIGVQIVWNGTSALLSSVPLQVH